MSDNQYYLIELFHWSGMTDRNIIELIDVLKAHPEYINKKNKTEDNCLIIAARAGNVGIVKYLIENTEIELNYRHQLDGNVLMAAAKEYQPEVIKYLFTVNNIDLYSKNNRGEIIYHLLAKYGADELIEEVLKIDKDKKITQLDNSGRNCLFSFIDNYYQHKNYWCFELIQEQFTREELNLRDFDGKNIFDFITEKQNKLRVEFKGDLGDFVANTYEPLKLVLESRTLKNELEFNLEEKSEIKKINKI